MELESTLPDDELVEEPEDELEEELDDDLDEEFEEYSFNDEMYKAISPTIKKFLVDYFGEHFYTLEAETYRDIEEIINEQFMHADGIQHYFYAHRTIADYDIWDATAYTFKRKDAHFYWINKEQWYDREMNYDDDDDEEFLEGIPEDELTDDQKKAKEFVEIADNMLNFHAGFADFMKKGCHTVIPEMQKYLEQYCFFDLSHLTPEGYEEVESTLDLIVDFIFDPVYAMITAHE